MNIQGMDEATKSAWVDFSKTPGWTDLMGRLVGNEAMYQAEGIKSPTLEGKGLAMAKIGAIYNVRTGIQDIVAPKPPKSA